MVRSIVVLLVLCAVLTSPLPSSAAPRPGHGPAVQVAPHGIAEVFGWFRNAVVSLWSKAGCQADPFGRCVNGLTTPASEAGCQIDPFGRCVDGLTTAPTTENGCGIDPFGRCGS
jgi:hypothetical protein